MAALQQRAAAARGWLDLVRGWLPADLAREVTSAARRGAVLTVYVASAAWAARLRFELDGVLAQARGVEPGVTEVRVKILPPAR
ncbi:MAG: hypothetical protein NAOJABEB_00978 [Steroidobacteraceae bacterium]|nr:hypothetical protein [Steroidobacteraceae bacterium]